MQSDRYKGLGEEFSLIRTKYCYNLTLVFCYFNMSSTLTHYFHRMLLAYTNSKFYIRPCLLSFQFEAEKVPLLWMNTRTFFL